MSTRDVCPKCGGSLTLEIGRVTWELPFYDEVSETTWIERCSKCGWNTPYIINWIPECPICHQKFDEQGRCSTCRRWVFDFAVGTTNIKDSLYDVICGNCVNVENCEYLCSALLSIHRMIRRGQITKIQRHRGIPYYEEGLRIKRKQNNTL